MRVEHLNLSPAQLAFIQMQRLSAPVCGPCFQALAEPTKEAVKKLMSPFLQMWERDAYAPRSH